MLIDTAFVPDQDLSATFAEIRPTLAAAEGTPFGQLVRGLKPRFASVWRDIALGYLALTGTCALAVWLARSGLAGQALALLAGSLGIGFWIAYLQLFIHEAAHANLAANRKTSDLLCDLLIGWLSGSSIRKYRAVHLRHHIALGTTRDSENTYFRPLDGMFLLKALIGWRAIEVLSARARLNAQPEGTPELGVRRDRLVLLGGVAGHAMVIAALFLGGGWAPALAWIAGTAVIFPFFGALRQLLEHRAESAEEGIDYTRENHGAYSRMFGTGLFARIFGGAGFNRHLLHHWEPQVSYTRFDELEAILRDIGMAPILNARTTTYGATFRALYKRRRKVGP